MKSKLFKILGVVAVVAMSAAVLVSPVAAMSGVTLAVGSTTISVATPYLVSFTLGSTQTANSSAIVVTFATGMLVGNPAVTIQAGPGNGSNAIPLTTITADTTIAGQVATINTLNGSVPIGTIGSGASVQLAFTNITNPATIGNYSISLSTAAEPTVVASNVITITNPTTGPLPGIASVYNSAGILLTQSNDLATALAFVQSLTGANIKLTAGTYHSLYPANTTVACTIQGTDSNAANVILQSTGAWSLTGANVTINSITIDASAGGLLTVGGAGTTAATVTKSYLKGGVLTMAGAGTGASATVSNDTVTVATGAVGLTTKTPTTVTGSVFNIDGTGIGINAQANVLVSNSTFTGTAGAGLGVILNGGNASVINTSTFTGLTTALTVSNTGAGVSFNGNTVTSCGVLSTHDAIIITATSGTYMFNNSISKNLNNIINVSGNDNLVAVMLNSFSGNAKNAVDSAGGVLNCTRNYWGGTASNPSSTANVSYASPLGAAPSAATFVTGASGITLTAATTVGINITASSGMTTLGVAALSANPVSAALPSTVTLIKYFDAFGFGSVSGNASIDFYGTTASPVTAANSALLCYNTVNSTWTNINATANAFANYMEITVGAGGNITAAQFLGTPFAMVNGPSSSTTTAQPTTTTTTTQPTTTIMTTSALSHDATLSNLTISSGTLTPVFTSTITSYTDNLVSVISAITVVPIVNQRNANVMVNGTMVNSGSTSGAITLNNGGTTITIVVTAQDGITKNFYTITVTPAIVTTTTQPITTTIGSSTLIFPINGATGVPVSGVTFTWSLVAAPTGSTITYQFALAQASANTSANEFAILDYSDNISTNTEPSQETLQYNTVYWWEVRAVTMNSNGGLAATGPWIASMFTTMPTPLTSVVITTTVINSPITTSRVTTPSSRSVFFSFWSYLLVAIGIIAVITVINLGGTHIRRKRRAQAEIERLKAEIIDEINRALKQ